MAITFRPADRSSYEVMEWFEQGAPAASSAEVFADLPLSDFFEELLCNRQRNKPFASFARPKGHPSLLLFCMGICPHIDFETILEHPSPELLALKTWIDQASADLRFIRAKMTLRKA